ncbi:MAG: hypothetical protein ACYDBB_15235 [Armatimonadota bacterium]
METPEQNSTPQPTSPPPSPSRPIDRLLSRLQGEDGYEIFSDNTLPRTRQQEQDDNRW